MGGLWFRHGSPLYQVLGVPVHGFGWEALYDYSVAWIAALIISYNPIFRNAKAQASPPTHSVFHPEFTPPG